MRSAFETAVAGLKSRTVRTQGGEQKGTRPRGKMGGCLRINYWSTVAVPIVPLTSIVVLPTINDVPGLVPVTVANPEIEAPVAFWVISTWSSTMVEAPTAATPLL